MVQTVVRVDLLANGDTILDGRKAQSDADLTVPLHQANAADPELRAVVRADASVPYGRVIHALDLLKQAGIERIAFGVTPVGGGAPPKPGEPAPSGGSLPGLLGGQAWNCSFPAAADAERIDNAAVILFVAVDGLGKPRWVRILQDPGYGFAQAAAECAMAKQYSPARDQGGLPVQAMSPPIRVRFAR